MPIDIRPGPAWVNRRDRDDYLQPSYCRLDPDGMSVSERAFARWANAICPRCSRYRCREKYRHGLLVRRYSACSQCLLKIRVKMRDMRRRRPDRDSRVKRYEVHHT